MVIYRAQKFHSCTRKLDNFHYRISIFHAAGQVPIQGSYRQVRVKFKDFSRTSKRLSYCLQRTENL